MCIRYGEYDATTINKRREKKFTNKNNNKTKQKISKLWHLKYEKEKQKENLVDK